MFFYTLFISTRQIIFLLVTFVFITFVSHTIVLQLYFCITIFLFTFVTTTQNLYKMDMRERLLELMNQLNMSPTQFATAIGASRTTIQHIMSGRNEPSLKIITSIYETFPSVDIKWLLKGEGAAFTNQSQITDYPLFENDENRFFQNEVRNEIKNSNLDRQNSPKNTKQKTDNKRNTPNLSTNFNNKKIKEIVVFFEDGTFEKFSENNK